MANYKDKRYVVNQATVDTAVSNIIDGAPDALNTLNEIADSINDNADYAGSITTALGTKLDANSTLDATKLSGALPSLNGSSLTNMTTSQLTNNSNFLDNTSSLDASKISGSLPAVDGSALTGIAGGLSSSTANTSSISLNTGGHGSSSSTSQTFTCPAGSGLIIIKWKITHARGGGGNSGSHSISWSLPSGTSISTLLRTTADGTSNADSGGFGYGISIGPPGENYSLTNKDQTLIGTYSSTSGGTFTVNYTAQQNGGSVSPAFAVNPIDFTFLV